jgi:hypothetical protein
MHVSFLPTTEKGRVILRFTSLFFRQSTNWRTATLNLIYAQHQPNGDVENHVHPLSSQNQLEDHDIKSHVRLSFSHITKRTVTLSAYPPLSSHHNSSTVISRSACPSNPSHSYRTAIFEVYARPFSFHNNGRTVIVKCNPSLPFPSLLFPYWQASLPTMAGGKHPKYTSVPHLPTATTGRGCCGTYIPCLPKRGDRDLDSASTNAQPVSLLLSPSLPPVAGNVLPAFVLEASADRDVLPPVDLEPSVDGNVLPPVDLEPSVDGNVLPAVVCSWTLSRLECPCRRRLFLNSQSTGMSFPPSFSSRTRASTS